MRDCRNCAKWKICLCGKQGHDNGSSIGYSAGECPNYEPDIYLHIYPVYNANHEIVRYELYSDNCTKPIRQWKYVGNIVVEEE